MTDLPDQLSIEYRPLAWLLAHRTPGNPKNHLIPGIRASILEHGYADAGVLDSRTERVLSCHGRLETLEAMRNEGVVVPRHIASGADGDWLVPIQVGWRSDDDEEAARMLVQINRLPEAGGWDGPALTDFAPPDLLADLWSSDELARLVGPPPDVDPDPAVPQRQPQGLSTTVIELPSKEHLELAELLSRLRREWGEKAIGLVILRALRASVEVLDADR